MSEFIVATFPQESVAQSLRSSLVSIAAEMAAIIERATGEQVEPSAEDCYQVVHTDDGFAVICTDPSL